MLEKKKSMDGQENIKSFLVLTHRHADIQISNISTQGKQYFPKKLKYY